MTSGIWKFARVLYFVFWRQVCRTSGLLCGVKYWIEVVLGDMIGRVGGRINGS